MTTIKKIESFIINAGTVKLNNNKYVVQNVNIYKSPLWLYCNVNINNVVCKRIYPEELFGVIPYYISMDKFNNKPSLLCNNAIIYQRDSWFDFKLEFIMDESYTILENTFYEYIITDIKNNSNNYIYSKN